MPGRTSRIGLLLRTAIESAYAGDRPVSERRARKAAEAGHAKGMTVYGLGIALLGRHEEARRWLAEAAAAGDPVGLAALVTLDVERGDEHGAMSRLRSGQTEFGAISMRIALLQVWTRRTVPFDAKALPADLPDPALPPSPTAHVRRVARAGHSPSAWARLRDELKPHPVTDSPQIIPMLLITRVAEGDVELADAWCVAAARGHREAPSETGRPGSRNPADVPTRNSPAAPAGSAAPSDAANAANGAPSEELARAARIWNELRELCGGPVTEEAQDRLRPGTPRPVSAETAKYLGSRAAAHKGDLATAQAWFERPAGEGDTEAMMYVAEVVRNRFGMARAEALFRKAADAGSAPAMHSYAEYLRGRGQLVDAERYFRRAVAGGHQESLLNLGVLLRQKGDASGAEACYREALKDPDAATRAHAHNNLANLLHDRGDDSAAEPHWRSAAEAGEPMAMASLGALWAERGDLTGAERWFRPSAEAGNLTGMINLAHVLEMRGAVEEATLWLGRASGSVDTESGAASGTGSGSGSGSGSGESLDARDIDSWTIGPDGPYGPD
ncbi:tetratricopeptide repeat protein [Streptomyces niveus]|uniref:tetratricopeptide repeat protein n=1 Tax=Streptomyces niveus TaxID=193462 RepID=UPI0033E57F9F